MIIAVFESLLNHDCSVSRRRRTSDGQGGWSKDYVPIGTLRGRIRPASSAEREQAMLEQRQITHVFYCLASEDVVRGDRLIVEDLTVDIDALREPSKAGHHYEFDALERQFEVSVEDGGS
jgi:SPP1 family predicted phage head-tail adaptor